MFSEGPFLATGSRDKKIILWDAGSGVAIHTFVSVGMKHVMSGKDAVCSRTLRL